MKKKKEFWNGMGWWLEWIGLKIKGWKVIKCWGR